MATNETTPGPTPADPVTDRPILSLVKRFDALVPDQKDSFLLFLSVARATASDELALAQACQEKLAEMVPAVELYREPQLARAGPYRQPLRVPMRKPHPGLAGVDEALAHRRSAFASALCAAKSYRQANPPMRQNLYEQQIVATKYRRIEIARLVRIRHELSRAID